MGDFTIDLVPRVMLQWRVRCVLQRVPIDASSGPEALSLVTALVVTLERGFAPPGLGRATRAWAGAVVDEGSARDALACLAQVVAETSADVVDGRGAAQVAALFEQLAASSAMAAASADPADPADPADVAPGPPGYRGRRLLDRRLDELVADSLVAGGDVAVGVIELERKGHAAVRLPGRDRAGPHGEAIGDLAARVRHLVGERNVYRIGACKVAVVAPGTDTAGVGELMLRTSAAGVARFVWGATSLGAAGPEGLANPDSLIVLAEADLHLRRRDLARARRQLAHHRRRFALTTVTSVLVLVTGILVGTNDVGGRSATSRSALAVPSAASQKRPSLRQPSTQMPSTAGPPPPPAVPASLTGALAPSTPAPSARAPSPARGGGTPLRSTGASPGSTPPAGAASAKPPAGGPSPSPVTAVLDQFLSTAVDAVSGVASLLGVHVDSAASQAQATGLAGVLPGG